MRSSYFELKERNLNTQGVCKPDFFRLAIGEDKKKFNELIKTTHVFLCDEIYDQLKELHKSRNPSVVLNTDDYKKLIDKHLNGRDLDDYGVWVYYPWSQRVVHILDEEEFIELRTSANKNKITTAERNILATKKVGVIGLSVGQSVSVTLAMERGCGELRLADFDTLELNNLNRIRTGVHNLGLLKAYVVAREIAEIDPYFKVVCYTEGITDDNINDFFLKDGKLNLVIDECDGVNIKILCRLKAKELNVPVLMEASDRGTLDVERFDLEPGRPIMHGWLEHLTIDLDVLRNLKTNQEKLPYILPISGLETLSFRMQASMVEMHKTLTTWPQLATAVTLGGALTADTCRRIFLDQFTGSGRYFVDLESLVPDIRIPKHFIPEKTPMPITEEQMKKVVSKALQTLGPAKYTPQVSDVKVLVDAAIKAPSASNSQPWKWHFSDGYLFLFYEDTGIISFGDFEHIASHIAHGAAIENLELQAHSMNITTDVHLFPLSNERTLVAVVGFKEPHSESQIGLCQPEELVKYIDTRATNRSRENKGVVPESVLNQLCEAVMSIPGAELIIKSGEEEIKALANIIGPVERLKLLNPASHYEFFNREIRWNDEGGRIAQDGISISSMDISHPEEILLKMVKGPEVIKLLAAWEGGQALEYTARSCVNTASAIGLITMPDLSPSNYILGGRAVQRMWLTATKNNIAVHPLMTSLLFFARLNHGADAGMPDYIKKELSILHENFSNVFHGITSKQGIFLFKVSIADNSTVRSNRKFLESVFSFA